VITALGSFVIIAGLSSSTKPVVNGANVERYCGLIISLGYAYANAWPGCGAPSCHSSLSHLESNASFATLVAEGHGAALSTSSRIPSYQRLHTSASRPSSSASVMLSRAPTMDSAQLNISRREVTIGYSRSSFV